ncbi:MAG: hypothetical protein EZS28_014662 [Streblomastix strix]|uniref:Uncharacterized protein n=1 Tax=Streblomastix strix TaxID=222440 RepID=A0A5J4W4Z7_9EUKA|nr:MAG: hypothetical protein EZS28_014662 [Streblomastix strix]
MIIFVTKYCHHKAKYASTNHSLNSLIPIPGIQPSSDQKKSARRGITKRERAYFKGLNIVMKQIRKEKLIITHFLTHWQENFANPPIEISPTGLNGIVSLTGPGLTHIVLKV